MAVDRRILRATAVVLAVAAGCGRGAPNPTVPPAQVSIAVSTTPASAALYVARDKGYFTDASLDATLVPYPSGRQALSDALSGKADFATASVTPIAAAALEGRPVMIVATLARADETMMVIGRRDRGIADARSLRGKRIGMTARTAGEFFLHAYLTTSGVRSAEAVLVDLPADELPGALASGKVDAICAWAPYSTTAQQELGANAVDLRGLGVYVMTWNLVSTRDRLAQAPHTAKRLLRAVIRANAFIGGHAAEAQAIVARCVGMEVSSLQATWHDYDLTADLDQGLILSLEDEAHWFSGMSGAPRRVPNFLEHISAAALSAVRPEAVQIAGVGTVP